MHSLKNIINHLTEKVPLQYQEVYDNSGLIIGDKDQTINKILICVDITIEVLEEAKEKNCELIISHHPLVFMPKKTIIKGNLVDDCIYFAIKNNISICSIHTNLDNIKDGVSFELAKQFNIKHLEILKPKQNQINNDQIGLGAIGEISKEITCEELIKKIKNKFPKSAIKYSPFINKRIKKIAVCGGSGSFLINEAKKQKADAFITSDLKYHDYFLAEDKILLIDIGHYESEEITKNLIFEILSKKFSNIAILLCKTNTNPIRYS